MAGIPAHDLQHHDSGVAGRRRLQAVQRLGRDTHRGVEPDRSFGQAKIVVDRLGHAHQIDAALLSQLAEDREAAVAADADQRIQP